MNHCSTGSVGLLQLHWMGSGQIRVGKEENAKDAGGEESGVRASGPAGHVKACELCPDGD